MATAATFKSAVLAFHEQAGSSEDKWALLAFNTKVSDAMFSDALSGISSFEITEDTLGSQITPVQWSALYVVLVNNGFSVERTQAGIRVNWS